MRTKLVAQVGLKNYSFAKYKKNVSQVSASSVDVKLFFYSSKETPDLSTYYPQ